ncbi:(2Fe-2S)-binding protein [Actinomadura syzygii]|uniref:2Fe-2S iron-sulfur cluster binding domain-containing protein n=1 Tax=Actinomadura syzygii TaxID=1427538 RepID=A0A5D0U6G5_9ACTN|nr:2Fe-2S iron-sulfur cluster-binding protein [Actinomadura syzygii]TYC13212.1 2Fe-2S iron-sulfur cluster binding domain-containing protein [Actinomadura syzygii]
MDVRLKVNGTEHELPIDDNALLLDVLRDRLRLTGAKRSCDVQVCGACTVLVGGEPVSSCCFLAHDARDGEVETIEGFAAEEGFAALAEAFARHNAFQCGYCAPGFLMTLKPLLARGALRSRADVEREFAGNLCRCTGYRAIVDAVCEAAGVAS